MRARLQKGVWLQSRNSSFFQAETGEVRRREKRRMVERGGKGGGGDMVATGCERIIDRICWFTMGVEEWENPCPGSLGRIRIL